MRSLRKSVIARRILCNSYANVRKVEQGDESSSLDFFFSEISFPYVKSLTKSLRPIYGWCLSTSHARRRSSKDTTYSIAITEPALRGNRSRIKVTTRHDRSNIEFVREISVSKARWAAATAAFRRASFRAVFFRRYNVKAKSADRSVVRFQNRAPCVQFLGAASRSRENTLGFPRI